MNKKFLDIRLSINKKVFASCDMITLDFFSYSTARIFTFRNLKLHENHTLSYRDTIQVNILNLNYKDKFCGLYEFKILLLDFGDFNLSEWWLKGIVYDSFDTEYKQGIIDIFETWGKGQKIQWEYLRKDSYIKDCYIEACLYYSSLRTTFNRKKEYCVDLSKISEESDFFISLAEEFFLDKGYLGHSFFTFKDCILELYKHNGYFQDVKIKFINVKTIKSKCLQNSYEDVKQVLLKYKFSIIDDNSDGKVDL